MSNPNGELKTSSELSLLSEEKLDETDQIEDERWGSTVGGKCNGIISFGLLVTLLNLYLLCTAPPRSPPIQSQLVQNIGTPSKVS